MKLFNTSHAARWAAAGALALSLPLVAAGNASAGTPAASSSCGNGGIAVGGNGGNATGGNGGTTAGSGAAVAVGAGGSATATGGGNANGGAAVGGNGGNASANGECSAPVAAKPVHKKHFFCGCRHARAVVVVPKGAPKTGDGSSVALSGWSATDDLAAGSGIAGLALLGGLGVQRTRRRAASWVS